MELVSTTTVRGAYQTSRRGKGVSVVREAGGPGSSEKVGLPASHSPAGSPAPHFTYGRDGRQIAGKREYKYSVRKQTCYLGDGDAGQFLQGLGDASHHVENLSRQFGCPHLSIPAGNHGNLAGVTQGLADLCRHLVKEEHSKIPFSESNL